MDSDFKIHIPESIDAKMSVWDVPADIRLLMEDRLRSELAIDPLSKLVSCVAPWGDRLNHFSFIISESETIQHWFLFYFIYGEDESSLQMVECGYVRRTLLLDAPKLPIVE